MNKLSVLVLCASLVAVNARTAYVCNVQYKDFGLPSPQLAVKTSTMSFADDFGAISFGNFYAPSGDVETRGAVRDDVNITGYSFGYELVTGGVTAFEAHKTYSLVVGGHLEMNGGELYPLGTGSPYPGAMEKGYAHTFDTRDTYDHRIDTGDRLDAAFDNAQNYFETLSDSFATVAKNAEVEVMYSGATVRCASSSANTITIVMTPAQLSDSTYWSFVNCNAYATLLVNVIGSGDVTFHGNNIWDFTPETILFNIPSAVVVNIQTRVHGSILVPRGTYYQAGMGVVVGVVIAGDMAQVHQINRVKCVAPVDETPTKKPTCLAFETDCAGLDFQLGGSSYSFRDFNAISFGDFEAASGDTEGRLAVRDNAHLNTYSVGDKIQDQNGGRDAFRPFSLVVGRDATLVGGLYPLGVPAYDGRAATEEKAFVGGVFTAQPDLQARRTGQCATPGCLDSIFDAAHTCYTNFGSAIAAKRDTASVAIQWSAAIITCADSNADSYVVSIDASTMNSFTYYVPVNCNRQAGWFINIRGDDDVQFSGDTFPAIPGGVVYNILPGSRVRTVFVDGTAVGGHIFAADSILNQTGGVILGKVVAKTVVASLQINRENTCPSDITYKVPVILAENSANGDTNGPKRAASRKTMVVVGGCENYPAGTVITNENGDITVESSTDGAAVQGASTCSIQASSSYALAAQPAGTMIGKISRSSTAAATQPAAQDMDSSATLVGVSVAAILAASLLL